MDPLADGIEGACRRNGHFPLAGVDEVGRGALAGPVVAAAVILPEDLGPFLLAGVNDSKLLSAKKREELEPLIRERALGFGLGAVEPQDIDRLNIREATKLAMVLALTALPFLPKLALIDGDMPLPFDCPQRTVVGGDRLCLSIAAASILAKVARDRIMREFDRDYPDYGFQRHKGYGTEFHRQALQRLGPTPLHRRSFAPVCQPELF